MSQERCVVAMSGGVDSSVAAMLMIQAGYDCVGVTLKLASDYSTNNDAGTEESVSLEKSDDVRDAERVCETLGIPHYTLDARDVFKEKVVDYFVSEYCSGRTPNPCIRCNRYLKFAVLQEWAESQGFDCLATGHYVQIKDGQLFKAKDANKDQSYVLYSLTPEQLAFARFPLGNLTKAEVRNLARDFDFKVSEKKESQDICFIPDGDYVGFIGAHCKKENMPKPGKIIRQDGSPVGEHEGIHHFTIGQRRGIGIPGPEPFYVLDLDSDNATVTIGNASERGKNIAIIDNVRVFDQPRIDTAQPLQAKHRYRGREHKAIVTMLDDKKGSIVFENPQIDLTAGQALVLYDQERVIAGGTIVSAFNDKTHSIE